MSFPFNLKLGMLEISSHLLFETLAFLIGFQYYLRLRKQEQDLLTSEERLWILIAVCVGALLFSRFIAVMEHIQLVNSDSQRTSHNAENFLSYPSATVSSGINNFCKVPPGQIQLVPMFK